MRKTTSICPFYLFRVLFIEKTFRLSYLDNSIYDFGQFFGLKFEIRPSRPPGKPYRTTTELIFFRGRRSIWSMMVCRALR